MIYYIYKIVCNDVSITEFYVGSTSNFRNRKYQHKNDCNHPNNRSYNFKIYETIRQNGGWDNWRMVIIEEMIDATKIQAHIREEYYRVELGATLNSMCCGTGLTREEYQKEYQKVYKQTNKEKIKEYQKVYKQTNKEKQKEYIKEYRQTNKEKQRQYQKEWRKRQKELKQLINI